MSDIKKLLVFLEDFPAVLERHLAATPSGALDFVPPSWEGVPSEALTIRQQICHLRDIEIDGYALRFSRVLQEVNPLLASIDTYELVSRRDYDRTDLRSAFADFTAARRETVQMLSRTSEGDLSRRGEFEGYGPVTLRGLVHFLVSHDAQHLAGIQWLIGKFESPQ